MKTKVNQIVLLLLFLTAVGCSDEQIPNPVREDDKATSTQAFEDKFLRMEISTTTSDGREPSLTYVDFVLETALGARITVNWGDGTIEKRVMDESNFSFDHTYTKAKKYKIKVSGELMKVTSFFMNYNEQIKLLDIQLGGIKNLTHLRIGGLGHSPATIDLSRNPKLEIVYLFELTETTDIVLSPINNINLMVFIGDTALTVSAIDRMIDRIYESVLGSPRSGILNVSKEPGTDSDILGPPTDDSIVKLKTLRDTYHWTIYPLSFESKN